MYSQFVCLSGLPRSGSTLLTAILSQNPLIHSEGNSAVCQLMWDIQKSCCITANQQLKANNRLQTIYDFISSVPRIYYKNITEKIVVDKCRSWTIETNYNLLTQFIDKNIKVIVLVRPVLDVVKSFAKLYRKNNIFNEELENSLVNPHSEPVMRSLEGIHWAKQNNTNNNFLFIKYDELINQPRETIQKIYDFCGWEYYEHDFTNIVLKYPENDEVYGLKGQHQIRRKIEKIVNNETILNETLFKKCNIIDNIYKL